MTLLIKTLFIKKKICLKRNKTTNLEVFVIIASFDLSLTNVSPSWVKDKRVIFRRNIYVVITLKLLRGFSDFWYPSEPISMALIANECRISGNTAKRKSQSIPSIQRLEICFAKTQSRFRSLESRTCDEGTREIEKLSAFLVAKFSCGIYYSLADAKNSTRIFLQH